MQRWHILKKESNQQFRPLSLSDWELGFDSEFGLSIAGILSSSSQCCPADLLWPVLPTYTVPLCAKLQFKACKDSFWSFSLSTRLFGLLFVMPQTHRFTVFSLIFLLFHMFLYCFQHWFAWSRLTKALGVCMLWWSTLLPLLISFPLPHHQRL